MQECLNGDLKVKLEMDYDSKLRIMKSDMQNEMDEKINFMKKAAQGKTSDEAIWKNKLQQKEKDIMELKTSLDLLEASSKSSARVAKEQVCT